MTTRTTPAPHGRAGVWRWIRRSIAIGCLFTLCAVFVVGCPESYQVRPKLDLTISSSGEPVGQAKVTLISWSQPHRQIDARQVFPVQDGHLVLTEQTDWEQVYPLCLHGVPSRHFTLCIEAPGYNDFTIRDPAKEVAVSLTKGESSGLCDPNAPYLVQQQSLQGQIGPDTTGLAP
tara:strand:- start:1510 stop:2034 length:525 start_codon:yes stop_codon:yes gene_type:complete